MTYRIPSLAIITLGMITFPVIPQPPNSPPPSYTVQIIGLREAEVSPDDRLMTTLVMKAPKTVVPTFAVQVWDFRNAVLVRTSELETSALSKN